MRPPEPDGWVRAVALPPAPALGLLPGPALRVGGWVDGQLPLLPSSPRPPPPCLPTFCLARPQAREWVA